MPSLGKKPTPSSDAVRAWDRDKVFFLHGHWGKPESVILDWKSYDQIVRDDTYREDLAAFWKTNTWVYVGCGVTGLSDPDFGLLLDRYGARARQAEHWDYFLVCGEPQRQEFQERFDRLELNIRAVSYGENRSDLAAYLRSLLPAPVITTTPPSVAASPPASSPEPGLRLFFDHLIQSHTKLFAGRGKELKDIQDFIRERGSGYVFVEGLSGYGKTSLLAELVRGQPSFAYHFISQGYKSIGSDFDPTQLEALLANLCEQIGGTPTQIGDVRALRVQFMRLLSNPPSSAPVVIVIDGIDEVDRHPNYLLGLLPRRLSAGIVVVLSARAQGDRCYLSEIGLDRNDIDLPLSLSGLDEPTITQLLVRAGGAGIEAAGRTDFVSRLHAVSAGDPFYLRFLVEDVACGKLTVENIDQAPTGLSLYLDQQLSQLNRSAYRPQHREILGFVLEAQGCCHVSISCTSSRFSMDSTSTTSSATFIVSCWFTMTSTRCVTVASPSISLPGAKNLSALTSLKEDICAGLAGEFRSRLATYCGKWRNYPTQYVLANAVRLFAETGRANELFDTLTHEEFRDLRRMRFGTNPLREDLRLGLDFFGRQQLDLLRYVQILFLERAGQAKRRSEPTRDIARSLPTSCNWMFPPRLAATWAYSVYWGESFR